MVLVVMNIIVICTQPREPLLPRRSPWRFSFMYTLPSPEQLYVPSCIYMQSPCTYMQSSLHRYSDMARLVLINEKAPLTEKVPNRDYATTFKNGITMERSLTSHTTLTALQESV
jgi:hypothetical protein